MSIATGRRRGLILDRDGVINQDTGYVHRADQCCFVEGIFALTKAFAARGFAIIIATNQSGIGRGLYGEADYAALMDWMRGEFSRQGVAIAAAYHCPDHPTAGIGPYRRENSWRKPGPGMILQAAADLSLDLARSFLGGAASGRCDGSARGGGGMTRPLWPVVRRAPGRFGGRSM